MSFSSLSTLSIGRLLDGLRGFETVGALTLYLRIKRQLIFLCLSDEIDVEFGSQIPEQFGNGFSSAASDYIADHQYTHKGLSRFVGSVGCSNSTTLTSLRGCCC